ncbi:MAG: CIA30 family protein [Spirochaetes bacterium]|jgi:hypothetical protein|nr:CIA30 family protein [Spirochaetota bacterium]
MKKIVFLGLFATMLVLPVMSASGQALEAPDQWFTYNDKGDGGDSLIKLRKNKETIGGKEYLVLSCTGKVTKKFEYGFIGFGIRPDGEDLARFRKAKGITFKVIGDGKSYRMRAESTKVTDYDYHGKVFSTKGSVTQVSVPYSSLKQEGWGTGVGSFNKGTLVQISFQTVGQPHDSVSLKIFDVQPLN